MLCLMSPEQVVPEGHPIRRVKQLCDNALKRLSRTFSRMYSKTGRPSVPPERLLKSMVLMALYSIRSERMLCEQLRYNLLFKWFLDMDMAEPPFDATTFTKNRDRLLAHDVAGKFFQSVVQEAREADLMSSEHFSVDGSLIEAWASMKSFRSKDDRDDDDNDHNGWADFRGKKRSNETHESKTDPEARLARKGRGKEAKLSYSVNTLMENRNGLLVDLVVYPATGRAERESALEMLDSAFPSSGRRITLGADKNYDVRDFVAELRDRNVTPHVAQHINERRGSAIDARTTRHAGYHVSQVKRRLIEGIFGWAKTTGTLRKTRFRGRARTQQWSRFVGAAYNLIRIAKLEPLIT